MTNKTDMNIAGTIGMIAGLEVIFFSCGFVLMIALGILHSIFPVIPTFGYWVCLAITIATWLLKGAIEWVTK